MGSTWLSGIGGWAAVALVSLALAGCGGGGGGDSAPVTNVQLSGIVVDGPVTDATVRVTDAAGRQLAQTTTDGTARFAADVPVEEADFPLTVTVTGGTNLVTGGPPQVELASFIRSPWERVTANVTLFSTFVVGVAERMPEGLTVSNVGAANRLVRDAMPFGLKPGDFDELTVAPAIDAKLAEILKSSETLAEMLRRTTAQLVTTGQVSSAEQVIDALKADLVDGVVDGLGATGANARVAAVSQVVTAQVLLEAITNTLRVNDVAGENLLNTALQQVLTEPDPTQTMDSVLVTAAALQQTSDAVYAAMAIESDPTLATISDRLESISADTSPDTIAAMLPVDSGTALEPAIAFVRSADEEDLEKVNGRARGKARGQNRDPEISGVPPGQVTAGAVYSFIPNASDPDGDRLRFSIQGKPAWASFDRNSGGLQGTPDASDVGSYTNIRISVSDGTDSTPLPPFDISVSDLPNGAPTIQGSPTTQVTVGNAYSFTPTASDPDGDSLSFSIQGRPSWASFNSGTGSLSGTPSAGDAGTYADIRIAVSDGSDSSTLPAFAITVNGLANQAPSISGNAPGQVTVGNAYSFTPTASDPDGDSLSFSIQGRPSWASFNSGTGRLSGTPTTANVGVHGNIQITVTDGEASRALPAFSITVNDVPNQAPSISGSPPGLVTEGEFYTFTPTASDPDGDSLSFSVQGRPSWASFNSGTGRLSGTPSAADVGTHSDIRITVTDGSDSRTLTPFAITVDAIPAPTNTAPVLGAIADVSVNEGATITVPLTSSDAEGDALTFTVTNDQDQPVAAFIALTDSTGPSGELTISPAAGDAGTYGVKLTVAETGGGLTDSEEFTVQVNAASAAAVFRQDANGNVVIEAEHFDSNTATGGYEPWSQVADATAQNGYRMVSSSGVAISDPVGTPVIMEYQVEIPAGSYYVWVRHAATLASADTVSLQVGNSALVLRAMDEGAGDWRWIRSAQVTTSIDGVQSLKAYRREGDVPIDRFIITPTNSGLALWGDPNGGPPESPRAAPGDPLPPAPNTPPTISGTPPTAVTAGNNYVFTPSGYDSDGDPLSFGIQGRPSWATFNSSNGRLQGTPAQGDVGTYSDIRITVTDGEDSATLAAFTIEVLGTSTGGFTLTWNAPQTNTDGSPLTDLAGYKIYLGTSPGSYSQVIELYDPTATSYSFDQLTPGTYYVIITSVDASGNESPPSEELQTTI